MSIKADCVFCKIVNKELDSSIIYETDSILAFLDINPIASGHTLVIPKNHYADITEIKPEVATELVEALRTIINEMRENLGADGFNIINSTGRSAGQTIFHFHIHLIPRFTGKSIGFQEWWFSRAGHWNREELDKMAAKILGKSKL